LERNGLGFEVRLSPSAVFLARNTYEVETMRRQFVYISIFLLTLVAVSRVSAAPQHKGSSTLSGVVLGPDDKPVAHANVSYQLSDGSAPHVVHTDSRGHFSISKLRADSYDLRASGKGVFSEWEKNIAVRSGQTKELTLHLVYAKEIPKAYVKSTSKQ